MEGGEVVVVVGLRLRLVGEEEVEAVRMRLASVLSCHQCQGQDQLPVPAFTTHKPKRNSNLNSSRRLKSNLRRRSSSSSKPVLFQHRRRQQEEEAVAPW